MSSHPMVDQVNRLIGNLLAGGGEVSLPGVGTLYTERLGAKRLSKRTIQPPYRVVTFTSQLCERTLVDEIASAAGCDLAAAQDIYDRWLSRTFAEGVLTLEGIGNLKFKHFTPEPAFDQRLNPQGREPVRIKPIRRFDWVLWIGIAAIGVAIYFGGQEFLTLYVDDTPVAEQTVPQTEAAVQPEPVDSLVVVERALRARLDSIESAKVHAQLEEASAEQAEVRSAGRPDAPGEFTAGRNYVVLGVFSTPENAARAVVMAVAKAPKIHCGVYRFGEKYLVSAFESGNAEDCTAFIREQSELFPDMWTYTAR